jgi:hypothetical protein
MSGEFQGISCQIHFFTSVNFFLIKIKNILLFSTKNLIDGPLGNLPTQM